VPYLHAGLDHFFASVPEPWGGGARVNTPARASLTAPASPPLTIFRRTAITVGPRRAAMYAACRRSLVTLPEHGCRLGIDELLLSDEMGVDYLELLAPYDVQFVLMTAGPDCLEERCVARNYPPSLAGWSVIVARSDFRQRADDDARARCHGCG
jgi:chloramphenicol 3-O-phosphotransferase